MPALIQAGHRAHAVTLTGVGERAHLLRADLSLHDHIRDVTAAIDSIRPRVTDAKFWDGHWLPGSRLVEMQTGHDPMVSAPQALTQLLFDVLTA